MKLSSNGVFNLGDTSFRQKELLEGYKEILSSLRDHLNIYPVWNKESQAIFYVNIMENSELFDRQLRVDIEKNAKRGRTLTNSLIKPGLINNSRELGEVAKKWLNGQSKPVDRFEQLLSLSQDNLVFLRQLLKLRVFDSNSTDYIYPFRISIKLLLKYNNIPENHFLSLLHMIEPAKVDRDTIDNIIDSYQLVDENKISFEGYVDKFIPSSELDISKENVDKLFSGNKLDYDLFTELFSNRKSSKSQKDYYDFCQYLLNFKNNKTIDNFNQLIKKSKESNIKKAFGFGKIPFDIVANDTINEFLEKNQKNLLLSNDHTKIYTQFILSKKDDLISEYSDMTKRVFKLSGIISFDQGLVNLVQSWPLEKVFEEDISLNGIGDVQKYEKDINSLFYKDITFTDILDIPDQRIDKIIRRLQEEFNISDPTALVKTLEEDKERQFLSLIDKEFSKERIIKLLYLFQERNDDEIKNIVTDSATIPTIFEYIIAIAWYYISDQPYSVLKSLNLTLDGDFKPLSHAVGGDGDIVIDYSDMTTMLEATLMNKNSQKRGELEPVIRHAANLSIRKSGKVFTIFIADELDNNVVNIFRGMSQIELESTQSMKTINSIYIFSFSISEIIELLMNDIRSKKIFRVLNEEYSTTYNQINIGWREKVTRKLFN